MWRGGDDNKCIAETLRFGSRRMHGIEIRVARIFNIYGLKMLPNDYQELLEPFVLLLEPSQRPGFLGLHAAMLLPLGVVIQLRHFDDTAYLDDGLPMLDQRLSGLGLAENLLLRMPGAFHGEVPGPVWPGKDSHPPWPGCRGLRH
jgi:hypothetical protein